MKKALSLLLVSVMLLTMTAFATYPTEVYFKYDFEDYSDVLSLSNALSTDPEFMIMDAETVRKTVNKTNQNQEGYAGELFNFNYSVSGANSSIETNAFGKKTLRGLTSNSAGLNGALLVVPKKSWNFEDADNQNAVYICSFDLELNPMGVDANASGNHTVQTFWLDTGKSVAQEVSAFYANTLKAPTDDSPVGASLAAYFNTTANSTTQNIFDSLDARRVALGFTYNDSSTDIYPGADKTDNTEDDIEYHFPNRWFYVNGAPWKGSSAKSTNNYKIAKWGADGHLMYNKPIISAIKLGWMGGQGLEYSDILVYTIKDKNDTTTFNVSMVEDVVQLGDKAVVKFSHPIAPATLTKDSFTIEENGSSFTMFEVGKFGNEYNEETGELYSTVELVFPYGLKPASTYSLTFNTSGSAVKNEIGWTLNNNTTSFTTGSKPENTVTLEAYSGLNGGSGEISSITTQQAKFTAKATLSEKDSYLFIGIYDEFGTLVSYTYTTAKTNDVISFATMVEAGYTVKAFSCGSLYNLSDSDCYSNPNDSKIN